MKMTWWLAWSLCLFPMALFAADDAKNERKSAGKLTVLGTIQGEITSVKDGGWKIEVTYKDVVPYNRRISSASLHGAAANPRFRLPPLNVTQYKVKNQEVEVRLLDSSKVRFVTQDRKASKDKLPSIPAKSDAKRESAVESSSPPPSGKSKKELPLPGVAGEPSQLAKGQYVYVTVAREDFPQFSRYVATTLIVIGEK